MSHVAWEVVPEVSASDMYTEPGQSVINLVMSCHVMLLIRKAEFDFCKLVNATCRTGSNQFA